MTDFEFNWKYNDFEVRTTRSFTGGAPYVELVKWDDYNGRRSCFTLAYWCRSKDGYWDLIFAGNRPWKYIAEIDLSPIWKQLFLAQQMFEDAEKRSRDE